jgi:hypothetical protein
MNEKEILNLIIQKSWFHKYEIVPGIFTPGKLEANPRALLSS